MTLKNCLEVGKDCGLETVGESIYNVEMHAMCIFNYNSINEELSELKRELKDLSNKTSFTEDSSTKTVLDWIIMQDDNVDEKELNL